MSVAFDLRRDRYGRLVLTAADGEEHVGVVPVRAFPLAAPDDGLSIVGAEGRELAWVDRLTDLPAETAALIEDELAQREFAPTITQIRSVSTFSTPSTWAVATDRGDTTLVLKGEEDIRRLAGRALLIADSHGLRHIASTMRACSTSVRGGCSSASSERPLTKETAMGWFSKASDGFFLATITPTADLARVEQVLGVVHGEAIIGANIFRDLFSSVRDVVGGRAGGYERALSGARDAAIEDLIAAAKERGADGVIGIDFDYEVLGETNGMMMVAVSGTAVKMAS